MVIMAPKQSQSQSKSQQQQQCSKYQYILTQSGPKLVPVPVPPEEARDEESAVDYNAGGYLPVQLTDTFKDGRYIVLRKLGCVS